MIDLNYIHGFFPLPIARNAAMEKHMLKEYLQLMVLDFLSTSPYISKLVFIGDTNLRLIRGIDRFSEDLDFDCKNLSKGEFMKMTDDVLTYLSRQGLRVEPRDKDNPRLTAYRRNIYFPELLFQLQLTGHRDERFLMKVEVQDQGIEYNPIIANVKGCNFFFPLPVPPDGVLLAMKLSALLSRAKGRDFYDTMFLLQQVKPDYEFLGCRCGIHSPKELRTALHKMLETVDLNKKKRDFEHLLFNANACDRILRFDEFIDEVII